MWTYAVLFVTVAVGVARQIKPVACPFFTEVRRFQQTVYLIFVSSRRLVGEECCHLFPSGWQPNQVEAQPSKQSSFIRSRGWLYMLLFEACQNEGIHGVAYPSFVLNRGDRGPLQGL